MKKTEWIFTTLGNLVQINPENLTAGTPDEYKFLYIDLSSVNLGSINYPDEEILFKAASPRARRVVRKGDILLSTVRPNLKGFAKIDSEKTNLICSTGFAVLRCKDNITADYIYQYIFSDHIERQIDALVVGSNYPAINNDDVFNLKISIPKTLEEQKKIADLLKLADLEIEYTREKEKKLHLRKRGLMQKLLTGAWAIRNEKEDI